MFSLESALYDFYSLVEAYQNSLVHCAHSFVFPYFSTRECKSYPRSFHEVIPVSQRASLQERVEISGLTCSRQNEMDAVCDVRFNNLIITRKRNKKCYSRCLMLTIL